MAKKGKPIVVGWNNMLPQKHLLTVDETLHWAFMRDGVSIENGGVPVVTHLHGGHTESSGERRLTVSNNRRKPSKPTNVPD